MASVWITLAIECEVFYDKVKESYGEDADGNRGEVRYSSIVREVVVHTDVPGHVQDWAKSEAIEGFGKGL